MNCKLNLYPKIIIDGAGKYKRLSVWIMLTIFENQILLLNRKMYSLSKRSTYYCKSIWVKESWIIRNLNQITEFS